MYHFKCVARDGSVYSHPCEGPYEVPKVGYRDGYPVSSVRDVNRSVHFEVSVNPQRDDFEVIYITNNEGRTLQQIRAIEPD